MDFQGQSQKFVFEVGKEVWEKKVIYKGPLSLWKGHTGGLVRNSIFETGMQAVGLSLQSLRGRIFIIAPGKAKLNLLLRGLNLQPFGWEATTRPQRHWILLAIGLILHLSCPPYPVGEGTGQNRRYCCYRLSTGQLGNQWGGCPSLWCIIRVVLVLHFTSSMSSGRLFRFHI